MGGKRDSVEIGVETSRVSMTPVRLLGLIGVVVAITSFGSNVLSSSATKADVETALAAHGTTPHTPTAEALKALEKADVAQDERLAQTAQGLAALRARIDFLIYEAMSTPRRQRSSKRAAARVRKEARARGEADPLQGVEGL